MEQIFSILQQIEQTSSRNEKENILKQQMNNTQLKQILEYTMNPFKIYGIGKKAFKKTNQQNQFSNIIELLDYLLKHNTGTDKDKALVNAFIQEQPAQYQEWYKRIILKDLKIQATSKTINKIWSGLIPTFEVMLAQPFERFYDIMACEVKIDGVRTLTIKQGNNVNMFTRNGKLIEGFNGVLQDIKNLPIEYAVFDGEIIGKNYTDTMNQLFAKNGSKHGTYMIFDMMSTDEFFSGKSIDDYFSRKTKLSCFAGNIDEQKYLNLYFVRPLSILEKPTIEKLNEITDAVVKNGYEGIMVKDCSGFYEAKRSYAWQKLKPFYTEEFEIIDFVQGDGKYINTLGKVIINVDGVSVGVGSGFTDAERDLIWNNKEQYLGQLAEIQYQEKIKKTGSLRFPTIKSLKRVDID